MLEVDIEKILPVTEARDNFNKLIDDVESSDNLYVLTKNGKPSAVIVGVHHLEKLTGTSHDELMKAVVEPVSESSPSSASTVEEIEVPTPTSAAVVEEIEAAPAQTIATSVPVNSANEVDGSAKIDLSNFPADDAGNEPAPITDVEENLVSPQDRPQSSSMIPGITNVASDPTLSTSPFNSSMSQQTIGQRSSQTVPIQSAPETQVIGQQGFQNQAAQSTSASTDSAADDDAPLEDPLDFLSNIEPGNQPVTELENTPNVPASQPSSQLNTNLSAPDDIVVPAQGIYAQPQAGAVNQPTAQQNIPQQNIQQ